MDPYDDAPFIGVSQAAVSSMNATEMHDDWVRVDDGQRAGWIRDAEAR